LDKLGASLRGTRKPQVEIILKVLIEVKVNAQDRVLRLGRG